MRILGRLVDRGWPGQGGGREVRAAAALDAQHLARWAGEHRGVEAFVEPITAVTGLTVVLVAHDGEWTRRRVGDSRNARRLGEQLQIPIYDVEKGRLPAADARPRCAGQSVAEARTPLGAVSHVNDYDTRDERAP